MTKEELKLALEELANRFSEGWHEGIKIDASDIMLLSKAAQALAQPEQTNIERHEANVQKFLGAPQRTWVGLTDEDKKQMAKEANYHWEMTAGEYAERIGQLTEAKLKELNT